MEVSTNAYYTWLRNMTTVKPVSSSTIFLKNRIESIFKSSKSIYGSARIQKQLERELLFYSRSYIAYIVGFPLPV